MQTSNPTLFRVPLNVKVTSNPSLPRVKKKLTHTQNMHQKHNHTPSWSAHPNRKAVSLQYMLLSSKNPSWRCIAFFVSFFLCVFGFDGVVLLVGCLGGVSFFMCCVCFFCGVLCV